MNQSLVFAQQPQDRAQTLVHALALGHRINAQHDRVGRQGAGSDAQNGPPPAQVIQVNHALGNVERVVVGHRNHPGSEPDMVGALGGRNQKHLGRANRFPAGGVMLADPEFVKLEAVEQRGQLQVALKL